MITGAVSHRFTPGWTGRPVAWMLMIGAVPGKETPVDAAELIVSALAESAAACRAGQARAQVMRGRLELISLLRERLPGERRVLVGVAEADPRAECARLADALRQSSADADRVVIAAARRLLGLLHPAPPPGTPSDPPGAPSEGGLGEGPTRPRASSASPGGRVRTGRPPGSQPGGGLTGGSRPMTTRGRPGSRADGDPITRPSVGPTAPGTRSTALGQRESGGGRVGGKQPGQPGDVDRVIVISGCSGIQVGEGNDQVSVYRVDLPSVDLTASPELAERLLGDGTPWARDLFSDDASLDLGSLAGRGGADSQGIVTSPEGDTLVIVRNSRGVQIGNGNVQHNTFTLDVAPVSVQADSLGDAGRRADVRRLLADPDDTAAARRLADDISGAARNSLSSSMEARTRQQVGNPHISLWAGEVRGQTGRQVGGRGRARVKVTVRIARPDPATLTRELQSAARRQAARISPRAPAPERPTPASRNFDRGPSISRQSPGIGGPGR